jgi:hypothetical protein
MLAAIPTPVADKPLTRREAAEFLTAHGYRISPSQFDKLCQPRSKRGQGPKPLGRFGRDFLYRPADLLAWAQARAGAGLADEP